VITTVFATFFYLRLIVTMYMTNAPEGSEDSDAAAETAGRRPFALDPATALALGIAVAATIVMGIFPGSFLELPARPPCSSDPPRQVCPIGPGVPENAASAVLGP
jgi:NADH:ubiquinone oxidoreductase subunit 2 (subunit N)